MAYILSLESSSEVCSVALSKDLKLLHSIETKEAFSHTRKITLFIDQCMEAAGVAMEDLSAIAVSDGPGSYTGLRVAAATAKGICYGLEIPLLAINTLKCIAWKASQQVEADFYIPMIDARRMEVYTSVFDRKLDEIKATHNLIVDEQSFEEYQNSSIVLCGTGVEKCRSMFSSGNISFLPADLSAKNMIKLAYQAYTEENFENIASYSPNYFKAPRVTTSKKPLF